MARARATPCGHEPDIDTRMPHTRCRHAPHVVRRAKRRKERCTPSELARLIKSSPFKTKLIRRQSRITTDVRVPTKTPRAPRPQASVAVPQPDGQLFESSTHAVAKVELVQAPRQPVSSASVTQPPRLPFHGRAHAVSGGQPGRESVSRATRSIVSDRCQQATQRIHRGTAMVEGGSEWGARRGLEKSNRWQTARPLRGPHRSTSAQLESARRDPAAPRREDPVWSKPTHAQQAGET